MKTCRLALLSLAATIFAALPAAQGQPLPLAEAGPVRLADFEINGRAMTPDTLPPGPITIDGATFRTDPGAVLRIDGASRERRVLSEPAAPFEASHLAFLHTFQPGEGIENYRIASGLATRTLELPPTPPILYTYEVHYEDGTVLDIPVRWGESIEQWYRLHTVPPMLWAPSAWTRNLSPDGREQAALYVLTWPNPRPEQPIASIQLRPGSESWIDYGDALLLGLCALQTPPTGRMLYVDPSPVGKDTNPGTFEAPFGSIQKAFDEVQAGDTVYLRGGYYALNRAAILTGKGGAPDRWITITSYPGETPVIDGLGVRYDASLAQFNPESDWGPAYQRDMGVIAVYDVPSGYFRIQGLDVRNSLRSGISVHGKFLWADRAGATRPEYLDVCHNTTYLTREIGINIKFWDKVRANGNLVVRPHSERLVFHVAGDQRYAVDLPADAPMNMRHHGQEGLDLTLNRYFEVLYNRVYGGGKEAIDCISVQDGEIAYNYVGHSLNGIYIDAWAEPISNLTLYRNFSYQAFNGIPFSTEGSNNLLDFNIYENILVDSHAGGINIGEATWKSQPATLTGHRIYNNTVHNAGYHAAAIDWMSYGIAIGGFPTNPNIRDMRIYNNIVTDVAHTPYQAGITNLQERDIAFTHNLAWPAEDRLPSRYLEERPDRIWYQPEMEGFVQADPQYVDPERGDFRLRDGSPAIGAGVDGEDLGALPHGAPWIPGMDFMGQPTPFYYGAHRWEPVFIPNEKFNTFRNHIQRPRMFQESRYGEDLQQLRSGMHALDGVTYYLEQDGHSTQPTVITLAGRQTEAGDENVTGIPVNRTAERLAFLHTAYVPGDDDLRGQEFDLAVYVVNYADGTTQELPVTLNRNIAYWSRGTPENLPEADVAWTIPTVLRRDQIAWSTLYSYEWENPRPDEAIASIDVMRAGDPAHGTIALFAISTGKK